MKTSLFLELETKVKALADRCRALGRERAKLLHLLEQKDRVLGQRDRDVATLQAQRKRALERVNILLNELQKLGLPPDRPT
ncbi:MAG: hypothetical protein Q8R92_10460 [Deltaproteobacteria bacterium]|nr:hypothetical protein [Deltaproteobacteria bacterium]